MFGATSRHFRYASDYYPIAPLWQTSKRAKSRRKNGPKVLIASSAGRTCLRRTRLFSHDEAARFYDMPGAGLDTQTFYESAARRDLIAHLKPAACRFSSNSHVEPVD